MPNFLALTDRETRGTAARYVILPIPYEKTTSYARGTRRGPQAILHASAQVELYDHEVQDEAWRAGIYTAPPLRFGRGASGPRDVARIAAAVTRHVAAGRTVICLGGEHTITLGTVEPYRRRFTDMSILHIDAHADLRDTYEGTPYSHACVMRRLIDLSPTVHVGIRSVCPEEMEVIRTHGLRVWFAADCGAAGWEEEVAAALSPHVYVTLDVDSLDPSIMPSTGTPEPGGLGWEDLLRLLRVVCARRTVLGADVTELLPLPNLHAPNFMIAKLVYRLIGYLERARRERSS